VLRGAARTLAVHRPDLLVELMPAGRADADDSFEALVALLHGAGYRLHAVPRLTPLPPRAEDLAARIPAGGSINVIARAPQRAPPRR
jgi:hypothetical protein